MRVVWHTTCIVEIRNAHRPQMTTWYDINLKDPHTDRQTDIQSDMHTHVDG